MKKNSNSNSGHKTLQFLPKNEKWEGALHLQDLIQSFENFIENMSGIYDIVNAKMKQKDPECRVITEGLRNLPKKQKFYVQNRQKNANFIITKLKYMYFSKCG